MEGLANQLRESALHAEQMEAERVQLQQLLDTASHDLQAKSRDLDSTHSELHASQMANTRVEQQVKWSVLSAYILCAVNYRDNKKKY